MAVRGGYSVTNGENVESTRGGVRLLEGSVEQQAIWRELLEGSRHVMVNAVAGSGKSTTLVQYCLRESHLQIALVTFNKHIADELKGKLIDRRNVHVMTYHSLGFKACALAFGRVEVDKKQQKVWKILDSMLKRGTMGDAKLKLLKGRIRVLVGLCKQYGLRERSEMEWIVDHHLLDLNGQEEEVLGYTPLVLDRCKMDTRLIDFDDMIWFPQEMGLRMPQYDVILTDESQDISVVQQWMALNAAKRVVVVGDSKQSIYSFRGADSKSMEKMRSKLQESSRGLVELPLTLTRRCPKSHVRLAQRIQPSIQAMSDACEGEIRRVSYGAALLEMRAGDLVVCRVNAELLGTAYKLLQSGVSAVVRGRDIGAGIVKLIEDSERMAGVLDGSLPVTRLIENAWVVTEGHMKKFNLMPNGKGAMRASAAEDRFECLVKLSDSTVGYEVTSGGVKKRISELFQDFDDDGKPNAVILGTIHRTKGLESDRVWVLRPDLLPHPMARQEHEMEQERNAGYIAVTRSKRELVFVGGESPLFMEVEE